MTFLRPHFLSATGLTSMRSKVLVVLVLFLALPSLCSEKDPTKALTPRYRDWLKKDAVYIITNEEKDAFLSLTADDARDRFIERFWEIRNPTPGSPENSYKNEHYRRIEYATQYFGHVSHTEGWRTDMGRIYITLGEPAQRQKLLGLQKITPMEIWFYSNSSRAVPPFFYIVFYQRDPMDEFRLYSPFSDGPEKLITAVAGPTRRSLLEDVTHRVVFGEEYLDIATVPLRDSAGNTNLHYVLRLKHAEDFTVGQSAKGSYYYSVLVSANVKGADGKLIFTDERKISKSLAETQLEDLKDKLFGYEGWLPLPPGKYKLEFRLANLRGNTAFHREVEVAVPDPHAGSLQISNLMPFSDARMIP